MQVEIGDVLKEADSKRLYVITSKWQRVCDNYYIYDMIYFDNGEVISGFCFECTEEDSVIKHYDNWMDAIVDYKNGVLKWRKITPSTAHPKVRESPTV